MNKIKDHIKSFKENKEIIDQNITQINENLNKLNNYTTSTPRAQLEVLSYIRIVFKEAQKEILSAIEYINNVLLDINIEFTYNALISSLKIDELLFNEEEKMPQSFPLHSSLMGKTISIPFITNMSNFRLNNLSDKLSSVLSESNLKSKKISVYSRVLT